MRMLFRMSDIILSYDICTILVQTRAQMDLRIISRLEIVIRRSYKIREDFVAMSCYYREIIARHAFITCDYDVR